MVIVEYSIKCIKEFEDGYKNHQIFFGKEYDKIKNMDSKPIKEYMYNSKVNNKYDKVLQDYIIQYNRTSMIELTIPEFVIKDMEIGRTWCMEDCNMGCRFEVKYEKLID